VESWVIAAVGSGLLEAKMDQLVQKVMVERCVVRQFDMNQWKILQNRLQAWKKNVGGVLDSLKQSQTIAAKAK
jgi:translation initiation factor 3 subunit M